MDNERPIEKLLRDYAKKRRADAGEPREMHPATRRLLQGEVARQFPKARREGSIFSAFLSRWRPGLVYAVCILAVVAVSVPLLLPTFRKSASEARHAKAVPAEESTDKKLPAVVSREAHESLARERATETGQTTLSLKDTALPKDDASALKLKQEKQKLQPARTPAPDADVRSAPATPSPAPQIASRDATPTTAPLTLQKNVEQPARDIRADDARGEPESRRAFAEAPPVSAPEKLAASRAIPFSTSTGSVAGTAGAAPAAAAPVLSESAEAAAFRSRYGITTAAAASVAQRYTQTQVNGGLRPTAIAAAPATQVLASFQLEQTGDQLRVIDSDGSTYTGAISSPAADRYEKSIELKGATALKTGDKAASTAISTPENFAYEPGQNYLFRVTGTNRTLQQPVVFAGNILILSNALRSATQAPIVRSQGQFAPAQNQSPALLNSTISGKVQLGTSREMQINAVPVNP